MSDRHRRGRGLEHPEPGVRERAQVRATATVSQAVAEYDETKEPHIRREVLDALANTRAAARQLDVARTAVLQCE